MFEMRFLFVLIVIFILEPTHPLYQRSVPACSENGETFCSSCSTASRCILSAGTLTQYNTNCTGSTPMCGPDSSDPSKFACTDNAIAECSCTGTGLSYQSDPYNEHWYILCSGSTPVYIDCGNDLFYNEAGHDCVSYPPSSTTTTTTSTTTPTPSICTVSGAGAHDYNDTCDTYFVCTSSSADPIDGTCQVPTNYFDPVSNECKEPPTRFQCPPDVIGTLGDPFDCRRYYVCFEQELLDVGCCGTTQVFDELAEKCVDSASPPSGCPLSDECAMVFITDNTIAGTSASTSPNSATSTTNSPSSSTPEGITSTSTTTSPSISTSDGITSTSSKSSSTSTSDWITLTSSTSSSTSTSNWITLTSISTNTEITTTTEASTTISTTTNQSPSCTPISNFECPAPDGFFPQCNYCAKTYFHCVSSSATLGTCTGNTVFNTVTTYPSCIPPEYCPYYP